MANQTTTRDNMHICNLCQNSFKHVKWLQSHMKSHSNWMKVFNLIHNKKKVVTAIIPILIALFYDFRLIVKSYLNANFVLKHLEDQEC